MQEDLECEQLIPQDRRRPAALLRALGLGRDALPRAASRVPGVHKFTELNIFWPKVL